MDTIYNCIDNRWVAGQGEEGATLNPATGETLASYRIAGRSQLEEALSCARRAHALWAGTAMEKRISMLERYVELLREQSDNLSRLVSQETGKLHWDARGEVSAMIGKLKHTLNAYKMRCPEMAQDLAGVRAICHWRALGVLVVIGPFNFPGHLPNGHILPALLAGNVVLFKPSEYTPLVGRRLVQLLLKAGLPAGVVQLILGDKEISQYLCGHPGIDGVLFTGSARVGKAIHQSLAGQPRKMLALEMGGNNPLIVDACRDLKAAVYHTLLSAYITSGQRCTCARRLIIVESATSGRFVDMLTESVRNLPVGYPNDDPEPFVGPMITAEAAQSVLEYQARQIERGAIPLHPCMLRDERALLGPGLLDCTGIEDDDTECFGPLLKVYRVKSLEEAVTLANQTAYGLSASLLGDDPAAYAYFRQTIRAGIVNWNRQTTGASGALPFGGIGDSGNFRPSGFLAVDYCTYPVSSLEAPELKMPGEVSPGLQGLPWT